MAFPTGWGRRVPVVIQASKVDANLTDFTFRVGQANLPVVDNEIFDADGSNPARADGGDIRFSSDQDGSVQLAREVKEFTRDNDPANGTAQIWVKVGSISSATDTTIYCWYNAPSETEPAADSAYGSENAWDENYEGVWHLEEDPNNDAAGAMLDSTSNANHGTTTGGMDNTDLLTGQITNCLEFSGANEGIIVSDTPFDITDNLTITAWIRCDDGPTGWRTIVSKRSGGTYAYHLRLRTIALTLGLLTTTGDAVYSSAAIADATWTHVGVTFSSGNVALYINGGPDGSGASRGITNNSVNLTIGILADDLHEFYGKIDEVRISHTAVRSAAWMKAEYESANDPNAFAPDGAPESPAAVGLTSAILSASGIHSSIFSGQVITGAS